MKRYPLTMNESTSVESLIQRGQAAARIGRLQEARGLLRRAVRLDPSSVEGWLALSSVEDDPEEKRACLERVLLLNPDHAETRLSLDLLTLDLDGLAPVRERTSTEPVSAVEPDARDDIEEVVAEASRRLDSAVGPPPADELPLDEADVLFCANHPTVETYLRCNRCGKPICTRCAVQTPVGYRCKQCLGRQQAVFYAGGGADYVLGFLIAFILGGAASFLMRLLGAWLFALILGAPAGVGIAALVRVAVRRRRSRYLWLAVGTGMVAGALPILLLSLLGLNLWSVLTLGLFIFIATGAAVARLR